MQKKEIENIFDNLALNDITLSAVESFTGGLFSSTVTSFSGVSRFFLGGIVTYSNDAKEKLGVNKEVLCKYSAVSSQVAKEMSENGLEFFNSKICISFTGNAGPNPSEGKKVGEYYIGISYYEDSELKTDVYSFYQPDLTRDEIRNKAVNFALSKLK